MANWASTVTITVNHARLTAAGGDVESERYPVVTDDERWCLLVCAIAGVAAEGIVFGKFSSGQASGDLEAALRYASAIRTPQPWDDDWDPFARGGPNFMGMFKPVISLAVASRFAVAYRMAQRIIRAYDLRFYRVVSVLLARKTATTADLEEVLGHRIVVLLFGMSRASFVVPRKKAA